jgi:dTDP-4-dehydrorhamnose 3,5-epimerase
VAVASAFQITHGNNVPTRQITFQERNSMRFVSTEFPGLYILEPKVLEDPRGFFLETYSRQLFEKNDLKYDFVQDNHARSNHKGVLRGLHFQIPPAAQTKLVRVTRGSVYDVAVDIRVGSPTYGKWLGIVLSEENFRQLLIPRGFAHAYQSLEDVTEFQYKVDAAYAPEYDSGIHWNDPSLAIEWPIRDVILAERDRSWPTLSEIRSPFIFVE